MSEIRLIDANALKYKNLAEVNGRLTYVLTAEEIDNAPTVDFEKLGESLRCQIRAEYGSCDDCELSCPRNELIKLLDSARSQGEWISVSERLPEENVCDDGYHEPSKCVLVQARNGHMYTTRYWTRDKKNVWTDLRYPDDIIAWQPLPEPYKEDSVE
jgi:hypothetical protein